MKTVKTLTFEWWTEDRRAPNPDHVDVLEESAMKRIMEMVPEGYMSGELIDSVRMSVEDPEDGFSYRGWWSIADHCAEVEPKSSWFVINGRIPGDDEDTCSVVEGSDLEEAVSKFVQELWDESVDLDPEDVEAAYGARYIVTSIVKTAAEPVIQATIG